MVKFFLLCLYLGIAACTSQGEWVALNPDELAQIERGKQDILLTKRWNIDISQNYPAKEYIGVKAAQVSNGCAWLYQERVPLIEYELNPSSFIFGVEHLTCHRLTIKNTGSYPGIVRDDTLQVSTVEINSIGFPNITRKLVGVQRELGHKVYNQDVNDILDVLIVNPGYLGHPIRLVIRAPSCSIFAETKVQQFLIKDVKSTSDSSFLFGLVSKSKTYNEKQYQYDIQHVYTPLTLCIK